MSSYGEALNLKPLASDRPRFGELARRFGVPEADVEAGLVEQAASGGRLGQILLRRRALAAGQLSEILGWQARWAAAAAFHELNARLPFPGCLSICLPAFNEEAAIDDTLCSVMAILPNFAEQLEVVVVDDGSRDQTAARVREWSARDDRIRLVSHQDNRGYGAAVASGLRAAKGDLVMFADSDGQFDFLDAASLLGALKDNDFTIGYRWRRAEGAQRRLNAWAWSKLVQLMLGVKVRDLDCAFKLFRRDVIDHLQLTATGACINAEIMTQCASRGLRFRELPVTHHPRHAGAATGARLRVICHAFSELPSLRNYRRAQELATRPRRRAA